VLDRNPRGRVGCRWLEAAVWVRGAVERLGRSRGGVEEEWRWEDEWSSASGERATQRQRGRGEKRREKVGVRRGGVPCGAGVPWGLALTGGRRPAAARAPRVLAGQSGGERADGGPRHSVGRRCRGQAGPACQRARGERERGRAAAWARAGRPEKKRRRAARMHNKILHLFELV
jgi:hypothetical protein